MMLRRWDPRAREYRPYEVPDGWRVSCYEADMRATVRCARCGRELPYGESYTSRQVHTPGGFGYCVCGECYEAETEEEGDL